MKNRITIFLIEDPSKANILNHYSELINNYNSWYDIKFLKDTEEVRRHIKNSIKHRRKQSYLKSCTTDIPDVIVFGLNTINNSDKDVLEYFQKRHKMSSRLEDNSLEFVFESKNMNHLTVEKQWSLSCGIAMLNYFIDHYCIGMVNHVNTYEYDLSKWIHSIGVVDSICFRSTGSNQCLDFLFDCLSFLQNHIVKAVVDNYIGISYKEIKDLIDTNSYKEKNAKISLRSVFGEKKILLNALFGYLEMKQRDAAKREWLIYLLKSLLRNLEMSTSVVSTAFQKYQNIYKIFRGHFNHRMKLSFLAREYIGNRKVKGLYKELDFYGYQTFKGLLDMFEVNQNGIITNPNLLCSVIDEYGYLKGKRNVEYPVEEIRLLILMLTTRLWIDSKLAIPEGASYYLTKEDYYNVLHPVINTIEDNPLLLKDDALECKESNGNVKDHFDRFNKFIKRNGIIENFSWSFEKWISDSERLLLKSIFLIELTHISDEPKWLK